MRRRRVALLGTVVTVVGLAVRLWALPQPHSHVETGMDPRDFPLIERIRWWLHL